MVAWYPLNNESPSNGSSVEDLAFGREGTIVGPVTPIQGAYVGNSMDFSAGGYIDVQSWFSRLNFGEGDFSIDAWVNPCPNIPAPRGDDDGASRGQASIDPIVDKRGIIGGEIAGYRLYLLNGRPALTLADPAAAGQTDFIAPEPLPQCQWSHVAATVDRDGEVRLYIDGEVAGEFIPTGKAGSITNAANLYVGAGHALESPTRTRFDGAIDEVEIFKRALSSEEVERIYDAGTYGKCNKTCSVNSTITCCGGNAELTVSLINNSESGCFMQWEPGPGCPGVAILDDGMTDFMPIEAFPPSDDPVYEPVYVPGGESVSVCVPLDCSVLESGPFTYVFGVKAFTQNPKTGEFDVVACIDCGELNVPVPADASNVSFCGLFPCIDLISTGVDISFPIELSISNDSDSGGMVDYEITSASFETGEVAPISLEDLPVGENVTGSTFIAAGETETVSFTASYTEHEPFVTRDIGLLLDTDGNGAIEPAGSIAVRSLPPENCPGDCDGNGAVEFNDLVSILGVFGAIGTNPACDADGSGTVDFDDLLSTLFLFGPCP